MSKGRELSDYRDDIITAVTDTAEFTQGMSYEIFAADKKTVNAVITPKANGERYGKTGAAAGFPVSPE